MAARPACDWVQARADWEAGLSDSQCGKKYGVDRRTVGKRRRREGWQRSPEIAAMVEEATRERLSASGEAGAFHNPDPTDAQRKSAIEEVAEQRATIISRHREEIRTCRGHVRTALRQVQENSTPGSIRAAAELARFAKTAADALSVLHSGERRAWDIDSDSGDGDLIVEVIYTEEVTTHV